MQLCDCVTVRVYLYGNDIVVGCLCGCGCMWLCASLRWLCVGFCGCGCTVCVCLYGYVAVWLSGRVAVRVYLYGYVAVWLCATVCGGVCVSSCTWLGGCV